MGGGSRTSRSPACHGTAVGEACVGGRGRVLHGQLGRLMMPEKSRSTRLVDKTGRSHPPGSTPGGGPGSQPDEKSSFSVVDTRARSLKERCHQQYLDRNKNGYCGSAAKASPAPSES